ncbi:MAG: terminase large subunit, partial [[Clostridium] aminophilum]|uniref:terminase large subunit domain-containing protein n=1 Tax=[Clostridium] aminophilum TaxID=1526 RepID=UPI0026EF19C8
MKIYAELIGDDEKQVIKSTCDNKLKSQLESGEALYGISVEASETGEVYEIYTAGTKRDQSKIVFNEADLMTRGSILRSKFNFKRDEILHLKTGSWIKALSKEDGKSGDGTNPAYLILDEYHQHKTTEFYDLGLGSNRKEPLLSIITTAGRDLTYPCYTQEYDYCSKLLNPNVDVSNDE